MVTKVSFHATIQNFLFMRLKDSSMVFLPGFGQFSQGFHILQILDVEKKLGAVLMLEIDILSVVLKMFKSIVFLYIFSYC